MTQQIKLNLGSGQNPKPGYVNVDKFGNPDILHDLEQRPWPWEDNCVTEVLLCHVLEHLGQQTSVFLGIIQELYRVCMPNARIVITVPHPRHDSFLGDPTHVRPINVETLSLFSKRLNRQWAEQGGSNSPLGLYLDVDFEIDSVQFVPDPNWAEVLTQGTGNDSPIVQAMNKYNNVIKETVIHWRSVKP